MWNMLLSTSVGTGGKSFVSGVSFEVLTGVNRQSFVAGVSFEVLTKVVI